jgi:Na+/proline symporter
MFKGTAIAVIFILIAFGAYLTIKSESKIKNVVDFFLHGENLGWGYLTGSFVAANLSLGNLVFVCAIFGYAYGWSGVFWVAMTIVMVFVGFLCFGSRFRSYIDQRGNFGTIHDFISIQHAHGSVSGKKNTKILTAMMSCLSLAMAIIVESHLGTKILEPILGIPQPVLMCLFIAIVCFYCIGAGFYSVVFTDVMQTCFFAFATVCGMWLLLSLPDGKTFSDLGYQSDVGSILSGVGIPNIVGLCVLGFFWLIATPDNWQRNCSTRKYDSTFKGAQVSCALLLVWVATFAYAGMMVKAAVEPNVPRQLAQNLSGGALPLNDIFLLDFGSLGYLKAFLGGIFAAGLLMAAISTVDTFLIVIGHVINTDLGLADKGLKSFNDVKPADNPVLLLRGKLLIVLTTFFIIVGWFILRHAGWLEQPIYIFFITYTIQFSLGVPVLAATYRVLQSAVTTNIVVILSGLTTLVVGVASMMDIESKETVLGLSPGDWMAMLPVFPVVVGILGYFILFAFRKFLGSQTAESAVI